MQEILRALKNLIHPVEFPLCGTPFGGFHRAGFFTPMKRAHFSEVTGGRN
jgi:hypothetical protein